MSVRKEGGAERLSHTVHSAPLLWRDWDLRKLRATVLRRRFPKEGTVAVERPLRTTPFCARPGTQQEIVESKNTLQYNACLYQGYVCSLFTRQNSVIILNTCVRVNSHSCTPYMRKVRFGFLHSRVHIILCFFVVV